MLGHSSAKGVVVEAQLVESLTGALADHPHVEVIVAPGTPDAADTYARLAGSGTTVASVAESQPVTTPEVVIADRDALSYMYTSGTTSAPKGVVSSHLGLYLGSLTAAHEMRFTSEERLGAMMPLFHIAQLNAFTTPVILVGGTVVSARLRRRRPAGVIERERLTLVFDLSRYVPRDDRPPRRRRTRPLQPAPRRLRDGTAAQGRPAPRHGRARLRVLAGVRPDRDGPDDHDLPARAPDQPPRRSGGADRQHPDRDPRRGR